MTFSPFNILLTRALFFQQQTGIYTYLKFLPENMLTVLRMSCQVNIGHQFERQNPLIHYVLYIFIGLKLSTFSGCNMGLIQFNPLLKQVIDQAILQVICIFLQDIYFLRLNLKYSITLDPLDDIYHSRSIEWYF